MNKVTSNNLVAQFPSGKQLDLEQYLSLDGAKGRAFRWFASNRKWLAELENVVKFADLKIFFNGQAVIWEYPW